MDFNGHSVLLVEDDSNDILFVERAFRQVNITNPIRIVKDGDAAIDYLSGAFYAVGDGSGQLPAACPDFARPQTAPSIGHRDFGLAAAAARYQTNTGDRVDLVSGDA